MHSSESLSTTLCNPNTNLNNSSLMFNNLPDCAPVVTVHKITKSADKEMLEMDLVDYIISRHTCWNYV